MALTVRPANTALIFSVLLIFVLLLQLFSVAEADVPVHGAGPIVPAVIFLGDSIVDPGNNNQIPTIVKSNFPPYGKDFPTHKATGRFSNGKISSDFIASELGVKELLPAYLGAKLSARDLLTGVSFASAGTGFDPVTVILASVIPMGKQLEMFKEYKERLRTLVGKKKAASIIAESLYIVCAGSNDVVQFLSNPFNNRTAEGIAAYRFVESKKGCCGSVELEAAMHCNSLSPLCSNSSQYVFWDSYHPTERASKVMVDKLIKEFLHLIQ